MRGILPVLLLGLLLAGSASGQAVPPGGTPPTPTNPATPAAGDLPAEGKKPARPKRILNDTTQSLYGPRTTRLFYEADALAGRPRQVAYDTAFTEMWNQRRWYHDTTFQQDLGNVGTAARPLVWPVGQPQAGIRWGRRAFDRYAYDVSRIAYYDARSPYSHLAYVQGARGEQVFEARYTRNVKRHVNFGGAYQRYSANKQLAPEQAKDNLLNHASPLVWATAGTPDSAYRVFAAYSHTYHEVIEQGGVRFEEGQDPGRTFAYDTADVFLRFATNREFRNSWHVTQVLRLVGSGLQLFYTFDRRVQANRFQDYNPAVTREGELEELRFFPSIRLDTSRTEDNARFRLNQHTAGVLGGARFGSYRLYFSRRDARYEVFRGGGAVAPKPGEENITQPRQIGRVAVGGEAQFRVGDLVAVTTDGELQSGDNTYWLRATGKLGPVAFSQLRNGYAPALTESAFYGNHFRWEQAFANTQRDESRLTLALRLRQYRFWVDGALNRVRNYIYYDQQALPRQESSTITIGTLQGRVRADLGKLVVDVRTVVTTRPGRAQAVYRAPEVMGDVLAYYQGFLFKRALFGQAGVQTYVQSDTRALAWQPATQQFYVQDAVLLPAYPVVDVFVAADISNVNVFLKLAHANQGMPRQGYYLTPGFPQLRRSFTFGVKWAFFD